MFRTKFEWSIDIRKKKNRPFNILHLSYQEVCVMSWPVQSPDHNPIENL